MVSGTIFDCLSKMAATVKRRCLAEEFLDQQPQSEQIESRNRLKMVAGAFYIPKNDQSKPLGEDAHFICNQNQTIGVADGVGGWADRGIDSGEYARELMSNSLFFIKNNYKDGQNVDPNRVLNGAFLNSESQGSSTALIISLIDGSGDNAVRLYRNPTFTVNEYYLHAANIGDSGFILIRGGKIVFESPRQQSSFNCPYQIGNSFNSPPSSAMELLVPVMARDIVVAATDGLFDNVYGYEIEKVVKLFTDDPDMSDILAGIIAKYALRKAEDNSYFSPFQRSAQEAGFEYVGGKYDDITVVVAYIELAE